MTETVRDQRNTVLAGGFTNPLNLPANAEASSHVKVYGDTTLLTLGVDYTLDGVGDTGDLDEIAGVYVIIDADTLAANLYDSYTVIHDPPIDQESSLAAGGNFGRVYEAGLDALVRRMQAVDSEAKRAVRPSVDTQTFDPVLPTPEPGKALVWNETGTGFDNSLVDPDSDELTTIAAYAAAALASQVAAAAGAAASQTSANNSDASAQASALSAAAAAQSALDAAAAAFDPAAVLAALAAAVVPVGAEVFYAVFGTPTGYLIENGAAVSRTTYAALFAAIGTTYGAGNGTTTFNLPESRGEFIRALDLGRGIDSGRTITSAQSAMVGPHTHTASMVSAGAHSHTLTLQQHNGFNTIVTPTMLATNDDNTVNAQVVTGSTSTEGAHTHTITVNNNTGTETRPRNVARILCIKY